MVERFLLETSLLSLLKMSQSCKFSKVDATMGVFLGNSRNLSEMQLKKTPANSFI